MIKGLYTAASSMLALETSINVTTNNLSNANTNAFKRDQAIKESFPEVLISRLEKGKKTSSLGSLGTGVRIAETYTDHTSASLKKTDNVLDLAIVGDGFWVVDTPNGNRYTRAGNFSLNQEGFVVTQQGYPLLGVNGPIQVLDTTEISVTEQGEVYLANSYSDDLLVVDFPNRQLLEKQGDSFYQFNGDEVELSSDYRIKQGYLEMSNVNIVQEMTKMIAANRHYELNQRVISNTDNTLEKAVNSIGRLT